MGLLALCGTARAQTESDERALIDIHDGISISKDSLFLLNLRFRMQNRLGFTTVSGDDLSVKSVDARVRRLRLRLDGYVMNERVRYYIQLNFSRADLDLETELVAQPIRDAMVYYHFNRNVYIGFGQGKLPATASASSAQATCNSPTAPSPTRSSPWTVTSGSSRIGPSPSPARRCN